jgi:phosphatidylinositol alpha-1,6-mannosyltransferase
MRRDLLVTGDYPPRPGGQARFLHDLWGRLPSARATVLAPRIPGASPARIAEQAPEVIRVRLPLGNSSAARIARAALLAMHAVRWARRRRVHAVHAGQIMAGGTAALACRRLLGLPYTLVAHGADMLEFARHPLAGKLTSAILRHADRIVANSRFTASEVVRLGAEPGRVRVLHPVVDERRFRAEGKAAGVRSQYCLGGRTVLLTVGRIVPRKGHDTVIEALPAVLRQVPDAHYLVVGDGPARESLEQAVARLGVAGRVTFAGHVPDGDLPGYYAAADLFVMVSRERPEMGDVEGFGIVYLEASAAGRAVVAARTGGVADAVEDGVSGLLIDPEDADGLEEVLVRLLRDGALRDRLARAGRERVRERFTLDRARAGFTEVMDELAGGR